MTETKPKRGRPPGSLNRGPSKYGYETLEPGDSIEIPIESPRTSTIVLNGAKAWAKRRGITDAKFGTMTYHLRGIVRVYRRR